MAEGLAEGVRVLAGRYEVGEAIGRGGMADVYVGTDTRLGRKVAIKLLRANLAEDPQFRARFRREAQDAAKMAHPTIVRIFDAGEEAVPDGEGHERLVPFIVMEYIDGRLLSDLIREDGPVAPKEAARIVEQVLTALEYSHRAGVVHRDIKPANVMITRGGQVKVMDFGIARAVSESAATIAETSKVVGTAQYFSPEQARGEHVDARTDLYSTGIVLFELLTGRAPFLGENPVAIAYQHVNAEPPVPSTIVSGVTPALDAVVLKSLAKEPGVRYQSAAEFRADLTAAIAGQLDVRRSPRPDAFAATLFGSAAAAQAAAQRQLTTEVDDRNLRTQSRPPVLWLWAGIVAILVIIVAVVYWIVTLQPANITKDLIVQVPSVVGQRFEDARGAIEDAGLVIDRVDEPSEDVAAGTIVTTDPAGGATVQRGETIHVVVSSGKPNVPIPDVARLDEATARTTLTNAGFVVGEVTTTTSGTIPAGYVVGTDPEGGNGATAQRGTTIDLLVSNGLVEVPDMTGHPVSEANDAFSQLGLDVSTDLDPSCGGLGVKSQSIVGQQPQGSPIHVIACGP